MHLRKWSAASDNPEVMLNPLVLTGDQHGGEKTNGCG